MICRFKASDPFDDDIEGADAILNDTPPPEVYMRIDEWGAEQFAASVEFVEAGCPIPEPPEMGALPLAA